MSSASKPSPKSQTSDAAAPAGAPKPSHHDNVEGLLHRFDAEFRDLVSNPNAPAERVGELLVAIHALRIEKDHQQRR